MKKRISQFIIIFSVISQFSSVNGQEFNIKVFKNFISTESKLNGENSHVYDSRSGFIQPDVKINDNSSYGGELTVFFLLNSFAGIEVGLTYFKIDQTVSYDYLITDSDITASYSFSYPIKSNIIQVPIFFKLRAPNDKFNPFLFCGFSLNFLSNESKFYTENYKFKSYYETFEEKSPNVKLTDKVLLFAFGAGFKIKSVEIEVRYLPTFFEFEDGENPKIFSGKSSLFQIGAGVVF